MLRGKLSKEPVSRRKFLKYVGAGVVVVAAGAAGAYYLTNQPTTAPTTTATVAPTTGTMSPTTTAAAAPVTLELWTSFAGEQVQADFFDAFSNRITQTYPNITLKVTHYTGTDFLPKLTTAMGAGSPPDMFVSYGGGQLETLVKGGQVEDLTPFLSQDWAAGLIPDSAKASHTFGGRTYALPYELNTCWLIVNKDVFSKAQIPIPSGQMTWDDLMKLVSQFKAKGMYALTTSGNAPRHMAYPVDYLIERVGGQDRFLKTLNREAGYSFTDAAFVDAFKSFRSLVDAGAFFPGASAYAYADVMASLGKGEAAMLCIYTWVVAPIMQSFPDVNLDIIPFPAVAGGAGSQTDIAGYTLGMAVAKNSKNIDSALSVLKTFAGKDTLIDYARITGNPIADNVDVPPGTLNPVCEKAENLAKGAKGFVFRKETFMPPDLGAEYTAVISKVFFGTMTPEDAAADLEQKAVQLQQLGQLPM
jgi:raffinose/stachyose/melibiose transport system substrate-binding protein